jgi:hypothetical protein
LKVSVDKISAGAKKLIEDANGTVTIVTTFTKKLPAKKVDKKAVRKSKKVEA